MCFFGADVLTVLLLIFIYGLTKNNEPKLTKVFIGIYALAIVIFFVVQAAYGAFGMLLAAFLYWYWQALDRANKKKRKNKIVHKTKDIRGKSDILFICVQY